MVCERCSFETPRLCLRDWHSPATTDWPAYDLIDWVPRLLTEKVTAPLPPDWQESFSAERARTWVSERDQETVNLLVVARQTREPVGLMFLFETERESNPGLEVRLGYLLAEAAWGKGLASELVRGFVQWCRQQPVASIVGGVERDNHASRRVLEKSGFEELPGPGETQGELYYGITLLP